MEDALKEMSGTSRALSAGTPGPVCQTGFENSVLAPPPVAAKRSCATVSFQDFLGMYDNAEPPLALAVEAQYEPAPSTNSVPPTAVISGMVDGNSGVSPFATCTWSRCCRRWTLPGRPKPPPT